jgi:hypothetical protein
MSYNLFVGQTFKVNPLRNADIVRMKQEGFTYEQIAEAFGLSRQRPQQIVARTERELELERALATITAEMQASNDLTKNWPCENFFETLGFPRRAVSTLKKHYDKAGKRFISFEELLEALLPNEYAVEEFPLVTVPVMRIKGIGIILYADMVKRLGELDLGSVFAHEYANRKAKALSQFQRYGLSFLLNRLA